MAGEIALLGQDFADLDAAGAAAWVAGRGGQEFRYVVTPNADHFVRLHRQPDLRAAYAGAGLRVLDSRVVAGLARLLGLAVPTVCPGSDLTAEIFFRYARPGEQTTIIGLQPAWLSALATRFGLTNVAHVDPPMGFWRDPVALQAAVEFVQAHPARFVFLALGSPGQEILAQAIAARGGAVGTGLCVGAALEFLAGARRRAPRWMQVTGLEWLYRLACEPRRLARRYLLDDPLIFWLLWRARGGQGAEDLPAQAAE